MIAGIGRYTGQAVFYALLALGLGYFSTSPVYRHLAEDTALIKLSLVHGAERQVKCRQRTAAELAEIAPNMRRPLDCPRRRLPIFVEIEMDGRILYQESLAPTGLSGDGPSRAYHRFPVPVGEHRLVARMRDSARADGYDFFRDQTVTLAAGQNLAIDFRAETGGFVFK